jgi:hypothetical protein
VLSESPAIVNKQKAIQQDNAVLSGKERVDCTMVVIRAVGLPSSGDTIAIRHAANQVLLVGFDVHCKLFANKIRDTGCFLNRLLC